MPLIIKFKKTQLYDAKSDPKDNNVVNDPLSSRQLSNSEQKTIHPFLPDAKPSLCKHRANGKNPTALKLTASYLLLILYT